MNSSEVSLSDNLGATTLIKSNKMKLSSFLVLAVNGQTENEECPNHETGAACRHHCDNEYLDCSHACNHDIDCLFECLDTSETCVNVCPCYGECYEGCPCGYYRKS